MEKNNQSSFPQKATEKAVANSISPSAFPTCGCRRLGTLGREHHYIIINDLKKKHMYFMVMPLYSFFQLLVIHLHSYISYVVIYLHHIS